MALRSSESPPILCAVLDAKGLGPRVEETAASLFAAGVDWIQLRDRSIEADALGRAALALSAARDAANAGAKPGTRLRSVIVNRRLDVALAAGADGVHLGFDAVDPATAAALLPPDALIGSSVHSVRAVEALAASGNLPPGCYVHLAPVWDPISKPAEREPLGPTCLAEACRAALPILAQGGIDPERASEAIRAGAAGVAVTGFLADPDRRLDSAKRLRAALDGQNPPRG